MPIFRAESEIKRKKAEIDETIILWRKQNRIWFTRTFGCLSRQPNNNGVHCCIVNPTAGLFRLFRNRRYAGIVRGLPGEKQKTSLSEKWSSPSRPWMLSSAYDTLPRCCDQKRGRAVRAEYKYRTHVRHLNSAALPDTARTHRMTFIIKRWNSTIWLLCNRFRFLSIEWRF